MRYFFEHALLAENWAKDVSVVSDAKGDITSVTPNTKDVRSDHRAKIALPGLPNVHSHAFQRAMAGMAEVKGAGDDSFWTWRKVMYQFLERLTPDDLYAIASLAYCEMLESGFTAVSEFHYLHHDASGSAYNDIGAMAFAIAEAAQTSGIGPTFLPVFYANSQFGGAPPTDAQRRFVNSPDQFATLLDRIDHIATSLPDAQVGIAPHSLRAVTPESLAEVLTLKPNGPLHIHIAEQTKEVDDCIQWSGQRPVEWLLNHQNIDQRWCLIHATHMTQTERQTIAQSGAVVGLCPITEGNLGDGIFPGVDYVQDGGRFAIGSDSNVLINAAEELRTLEYTQRFRDRGRNLLGTDNTSTGRALFDHALSGGTQSLGRKIGKIDVGFRADIITLNTDHPALVALINDGWLDGWIFAANSPAISDVWVGGRHVVSEGKHHKRDQIRAHYSQTMKRLTT
ncbi:MAG: formimidoylglutamate deiminase [Rhodospirillales bacterium]|nr:formimidoylglutamate deiminase [Rhodospirillales bacterium]